MRERFLLYLDKVKQVRRAPTKHGRAMHKPILLLTLIELIEAKEVHNNQFEISPDLITRFYDNWALFVKSHPVKNIHLPLQHLQNDGFWHLVPRGEKSLPNTFSSLTRLIERVAYGTLDPAFFDLLQEDAYRWPFAKGLIEGFMPEKLGEYQAVFERAGQRPGQENWILADKEIPYKTKELIEATGYIRKGIFKKMVPRVYNFTCAITGMRVEDRKGKTMIDACHIIPFKETANDTIPNGIALCPNLHRAFDNGWLTITPDYRVNISSAIAESESMYSLRKLEGQLIRLPFGTQHYPKKEYLSYHNQAIFLG